MTTKEETCWTIEEESWSQVLGHAIASYPKEACGLLLMDPRRPEHITAVRPARNATPENPAIRYLVDPLEFLEADNWAAEKGLDICGFYHSHPDHPCAPSEYDRKTAWEGYLYVIISIRKGKLEEARAWIYDQDAEHFNEAIFQTRPP